MSNFITDDTVSAALDYLSLDPHPVAVARKDLTDCENKRKYTYALLFGKTSGTVRERECAVEADGQYTLVCDYERDAILEVERHKAKVRAAEMLIEVWRTANANARAAERVR